MAVFTESHIYYYFELDLTAIRKFVPLLLNFRISDESSSRAYLCYIRFFSSKKTRTQVLRPHTKLLYNKVASKHEMIAKKQVS
jgi:hypothetical protein